MNDGVKAHVEDICVAPPNATSIFGGIYNFYTLASRLGCDYRDRRLKCIVGVLATSGKTFGDTSICRGVIHFNSIYFSAVALGFKQDVAYFLAAFSQSIDFVQYAGIDSCGKNMSNNYWTPPMRGFLRTNVQYGGTNRHLGVPFVGFFEEDPIPLNETGGQGTVLDQSRKTYNGNSKSKIGCRSKHFRRSFDNYVTDCPALRPNVTDPFYEGSLLNGRRWAFNETNLLCIGGFTKIDPKTGSPFTGDECLPGVVQKTVNIDNTIVQGPIPLTTNPLETGVQVVHYDCNPNCSASNYTKSNFVYSTDFDNYLATQAHQNGYAIMKDPPGRVPELIARMGIYLHWIADRASHWYCTDAGGSGIVGVKSKIPNEYRIYMYLENMPCFFLTHGMVHYWEQGVTKLAPGSYTALKYQFDELKAFREKFLNVHPEWFRPKAQPLTSAQVVGTYMSPGILFKITLIEDAELRMKAEMDALANLNLPPIPGFEQLCPEGQPSVPSLPDISKQDQPNGLIQGHFLFRY